jgi:hypothetical protein
MIRDVDVALGFTLRVEGAVDPKTVGQEFCRLLGELPQIGNPDWIATPTGVVFLQATERADAETRKPNHRCGWGPRR